MKRRRRKAAPNAIAGAASAGITTLCASPCQSTPFSPDCTSAAPTKPPISACDELEGKPNHQVSRFQAIAPSNAAKIVCCVARFASISPLATFFATAVVTNAPARFATDAINTAIRGVTARVPTEVAQLVQLSARVLEALEPVDRLVQLLGAAQDHLSLFFCKRSDLIHAVADDVPRGLVDVVADVVDCTREVVDVIAVERRDESP